jgi:hypothetical protein
LTYAIRNLPCKKSKSIIKVLIEKKLLVGISCMAVSAKLGTNF